MPDLMNFSMVRNGSVNANIPRFDITCDVVNSETGAFIKTLSGSFPASLQTFTAAELDSAFREFVKTLVLIKANQ